MAPNSLTCSPPPPSPPSVPPCPQPSPAKLSWRHRVFCLLGHCQGFLCPVRVRKHRADPHPQDLREDRSPLQAGAHRPYRQALTTGTSDGRGVPENGRFRAACGEAPPGSPEEDRFRATADERPPMICEKAVSASLTARRFLGFAEGDRFRFAAGPGGPRNRPFSRCCRPNAPAALTKKAKSMRFNLTGAP